MQLAHLANTLPKDEGSARNNHVLAYNPLFTDLKKNFTHRLSNKRFLIWLLTIPHTLNMPLQFDTRSHRRRAWIVNRICQVATMCTFIRHMVPWGHTSLLQTKFRSVHPVLQDTSVPNAPFPRYWKSVMRPR